jgi:hypothetical protein
MNQECEVYIYRILECRDTISTPRSQPIGMDLTGQTF